MYEIKNKTKFPKRFFNRIASKWVIVPAGGKVLSQYGFESNSIFEVKDKSKKTNEVEE